MDKNYAIANLEEAREHIADLINELKTSKDLNELDGLLLATVQEIYWHINKVWNGRNLDQKSLDQTHDDAFDELCGFPKDLKL